MMSEKIKETKKFIKRDSDDFFLAETQVFNIDGLCISSLEFDNEDTLVRKYEAKYDTKNLPIFEKTVEVEDDFEEIKHYEYNDSGVLIKEIIETNAEWKTIKIYEYDDNKKIVIIKSYDEEDEIEESSEIQYNDNHKIIYKKDFDANGKLTRKVENNYDDSENLINYAEYDRKERLEKEYDYSYRSDNRLEEIIVYNLKGKIIDWTKNEYDEDGKINKQLFMSGEYKTFDYENNKTTEHHFASNGVEARTIETIFNKNGTISEENTQINQIHSFSSQIVKFEYVIY